MPAAMAETLALAPVEDPEAPLDAVAIRSRFEQLSTLWGGDEEEPVDAAAAEDELRSGCEADMQAGDAWDSSAAELESRCLDSYIEWLRKEVSLTEEENCKLSAEIGVIGETVFKDTIPLDAEIESLESSLNTLDSEGLKHSEASPISTDSSFNQIDIEKDCKYEELELDHQIGKGEMDLKLLQIQSISMQRDEEMWQLQSLVSGPKVLECKDNSLRVFLKAPLVSCTRLGCCSVAPARGSAGSAPRRQACWPQLGEGGACPPRRCRTWSPRATTCTRPHSTYYLVDQGRDDPLVRGGLLDEVGRGRLRWGLREGRRPADVQPSNGRGASEPSWS